MYQFFKRLLCPHKNLTVTKFYRFETDRLTHLVVYQQSYCSDCGKRSNKQICDYDNDSWNLGKVAQHLEAKGVLRIENSAVIV